MTASETLTIRLPGEEKSALEAMAEAETRSVTSFLRMLIRREIAARALAVNVVPLRRPALKAKPASKPKKRAAGR